MGVVMSLIPAAMGLVGILLAAFHRPYKQNPTIADIEALHLAERLQKEAEQSAREAREYAERIRQQADQDREEARRRQEEAKEAAAQAAREAERLRVQMEEAVSAAQRAQEFSETAANAAREEAVRLVREAQEERTRAQRMHEDAERAMAGVREEAERAQLAADEQLQEAETGRERAEELSRIADEETRKAMEAKQEVERCLKEGIQPVVIPTPEELTAAKMRVQYEDDRFHFAIAGVSGSGKSSLVNAFRGLSTKDEGAAAVGVVETTHEMDRYPDTNPENPFVWYDIPGAGTLGCRDWQYFNDQGLYVFDCIVVLFDNRFTMTDVAILTNARRFNIPTYIVRSKADQHIRNIVIDMGYDTEDEEEDIGRLYTVARQQFIEKTRKSVQANLKDANLADQRVYIVSNLTMLHIMQNKMPKNAIDEVDLLNDLLNQVYSRRVIMSGDSELISSREESGV